MGPAASLAARDLGMDFAGADGWRMYHGSTVPGFPQHPHRGFETVTFVRQGYIDHSDSLGATARFGRGDVQWLTAGSGIVHSDALSRHRRAQPDRAVPDLANLPASDKMVEPYFTMLWARHPGRRIRGRQRHGRRRSVGRRQARLAATQLVGRATMPKSRSGAAAEPGAPWTMPPTVHPDVIRALYFFVGDTLDRRSRAGASTGAVVQSDTEVE
jgi:redox-sensitive bicupin YhaK (pirin superfamily)